MNFSSSFQGFVLVNFVVGLCGNEDIVYMADMYFGHFYCDKYFVFDMVYVKFGYRGSKWRTHTNIICLCVYFFLKGRRKELVLCRHGEVFRGCLVLWQKEELDSEVRRRMRRFEHLHLKILKKKQSAVFNQTCLDNDLLPQYTIYIYMYVCM